VASELARGPASRAHAAVGFHPTATTATSSSRRGKRLGTLETCGGSCAHDSVQMTSRHGDLDAVEQALPTGGRGSGNSDDFPAIDGDGRRLLFGMASLASTPGKQDRAH
jgi:hypothetical protein